MIIRCVDLETTGLEPSEHAVCEIGYVDVIDREHDIIGARMHWTVIPKVWGHLVNPERPIPPETSAIHHIVDEDVCNAPTWAEAVDNMLVGRAPVAHFLAAHNAKFERMWLTDKVTGALPWICTYKCALRLWPDAPSHSNQALRYWRRPEGLDRTVANVAHRAGPDAYVTAHHLRDMLALVSVEQLIEWSSQPALLLKCRFGKHQGKLWSEVPSDYLSWAARQDMDEDVAFTIKHEIKRRQGSAP